MENSSHGSCKRTVWLARPALQLGVLCTAFCSQCASTAFVPGVTRKKTFHLACETTSVNDQLAAGCNVLTHETADSLLANGTSQCERSEQLV